MTSSQNPPKPLPKLPPIDLQPTGTGPEGAVTASASNPFSTASSLTPLQIHVQRRDLQPTGTSPEGVIAWATAQMSDGVDRQHQRTRFRF